MTVDGSIGVLLVEDHTLMRFGIKNILNTVPELKVLGETDSGVAAVELAQKLRPKLVLMDLRLAVSGGIAATKEIKRLMPEIMVLALTSFDDSKHLMEAMTAGADGYCVKTISAPDLVKAILTVASGEPWIDPALAAEVYKTCNGSSPKTEDVGPTLTPRELEILKLIIDGATNPQIAKELFVSLETVKTHVRHILEKLSATDRTQAAVEAMKRGLI